MEDDTWCIDFAPTCITISIPIRATAKWMQWFAVSGAGSIKLNPILASEIAFSIWTTGIKCTSIHSMQGKWKIECGVLEIRAIGMQFYGHSLKKRAKTENNKIFKSFFYL